jgi:hypothetical protein
MMSDKSTLTNEGIAWWLYMGEATKADNILKKINRRIIKSAMGTFIISALS